jgi:riboflavin kinase/FMN adenylyltransferase
VQVLAPAIAPAQINTHGQKIELLAKLGLNATVAQKFDLRFARITPEAFFTCHLLTHLNARYISVGYDFTFGAKRQGTIETLERLGHQHGVQIHIVDAKMRGKMLVSSTIVRKLIGEGDVRGAKTLLTQPFFIDGRVVRGHRRGGELGIHTANLKTDNELLPRDGVYATLVEVSKRVYKSVTNIGFNPTFDNRERSVETHIFHFDRDIYGRPLRLMFIERLRDEIKFGSKQDLIAQIQKDCATARRILVRRAT